MKVHGAAAASLHVNLQRLDPAVHVAQQHSSAAKPGRGVAEEDCALLLGHAIAGMPQHYATATIARLVEAANKTNETCDCTTLLRVVNG